MHATLPFACLQIRDNEKEASIIGLLDSGCSKGGISRKALNRLGLKFEEYPFKGKLRSFTGNDIPIKSQVKIPLNFRAGWTNEICFVVFEQDSHYDLIQLRKRKPEFSDRARNVLKTRKCK